VRREAALFVPLAISTTELRRPLRRYQACERPDKFPEWLGFAHCLPAVRFVPIETGCIGFFKWTGLRPP
jgi:hypothetical protein